MSVVSIVSSSGLILMDSQISWITIRSLWFNPYLLVGLKHEPPPYIIDALSTNDLRREIKGQIDLKTLQKEMGHQGI